MTSTLNGKSCTCYWRFRASPTADRVRWAAVLAGLLELTASCRWQRAVERLTRTGTTGLTAADDAATAHSYRTARWLRRRYGLGHSAHDLARVEAAVDARCRGRADG